MKRMMQQEMIYITNRIVLIGAESVGKSTTFNALKNHKLTMHLNYIEEAARQLDINVTTNDDKLKLQKIIYQMHSKLENKYYETGYIADRCIIDSFIYYQEICSEFQTSKQIDKYRQLVLNAVDKYTLILYLPIQYPVISDGFRYANEDFRHKIDYELKNFLYTYDIPYETISGKIDIRMNKIIKLLHKSMEE